MEYRKKIPDVFQEKLCQEYLNYCERQSLQATPEGLITYMIDRDIIPAVSIRRYAILKEFAALQAQQKNKKTKTVHDLSDRFNISERSIWAVLKREQTKKIE